LKRPEEFEDDAGAAHVGETGFGSGIFYLYVCIDKALLVKNLGGAAALAARGLDALTEALATVSPTGKQASFASRARADFILAERGHQQPRTLAGAFVKPVNGSDILVDSISRLKTTRKAMDNAYGPCWEDYRIMDVKAGEALSLRSKLSLRTRENAVFSHIHFGRAARFFWSQFSEH
jgi:CRISPR system Cascade subunit CasC